MIEVKRLNHAVLMIRELDRSVEFYRRVFGMEEIAREGGAMAFLRSPSSGNHHDLGLFALGPKALDAPRNAVGLYHTAWEVATIDELAVAHETLRSLGALTGASDHGATKSVYGVDPDGIEFEILWPVPREAWGEYEHSAPTRPLNLAAEVARFGSGAQ